MKIVREAFRKVLRDLDVPFEGIVWNGEYAKVELSGSFDGVMLLRKIRGDPRYDKLMQTVADGVFLVLPNLTNRQWPVLADVAVKFTIMGGHVLAITCALMKAQLFKRDGSVAVSFSVTHLMKAMAREGLEHFLDAEVNSGAE